ncbi:cupin domain-containing protein [Pelomonas sp. SE-A7]|uniref:cupin domain-containing protein n=1 Tax=Pelomonas sp. SE-A7 TaxID=3054953 RepID=UPI00259C8BEE|nr:cupin domain-containing protein [Pelomonas sp. SE-A7]MDM4766850.1 cupin domain-containing protein [Pelomonas sp. SE-A7]
MKNDSSKKGIECITRMATGVGRVVVPEVPADTPQPWIEKEWRVAERPAGRFYGGSWAGEVGRLPIEYTFDEFCFMLSGRVALVDQGGGRVEFGAGDAFHVAKGFVGEWLTLEPASKHFVIVE